MFINTLPILFTYTNLLKPVEFAILLVVIFLMIHFNSRSPNQQGYLMTYDNPPAHGVAHYFYLRLLNLWLGRASLSMAFWPFFMFVNAVLYYIDYRIFNLDFTIASWKTAQFMLVLPIIWWLVSVWRCTVNTRHKFWGSAARAITIYLLLEFVLRFIIVSRYPNTFFDCQLLIVHYGDCL